MAKRKRPIDDLTVKAADCYDPADYVMVHKDYLARLLYALKRIADDDGIENCYQNVAKSALGKHNAVVDTEGKS